MVSRAAKQRSRRCAGSCLGAQPIVRDRSPPTQAPVDRSSERCMMKPDKAFSDLIGRIYDCALDTDRWPDVLAEITDALGGIMGDISISDPLAGRWRLAAFHNWPEEV